MTIEHELGRIADSLERFVEYRVPESFRLGPDTSWGEPWTGSMTPEPENTIYKSVVSNERYEARVKLATQALMLQDDYMPETYGRKGPAWLYAYDRDMVMQLPVGIKRVLIEDLEQDDPQAAQEMSRDILKSTGSGMAGGVMLGEGNVG